MGRTVARHVLQARALRDAVSDVWYARHSQRPSQQALVRVIDPDVAPDPVIEACLAEARASAGVLHRNVLRVHGAGDAANPFVLHRFATVTPLAAHLRTPWAVAEAVEVLGAAGAALDAAADAGIPHGAVHPRTIWIEDRRAHGGPRRALVAGFGVHHLLASLAAGERRGVPTDDFRYVAPELIRGGSPTNRSDQYALAAAFHHVLTGRPPFERRTLAALFGAHLFAQPASLIGAAPDADPALEEILGRALAKDPAERFDRCEALVAAIVAWHDDRSDPPVVAGPTRGTAPRSLPAKVVPPPRRKPVRAAAAAAIVGVVIAGAGALVLAGRPSRAPDAPPLAPVASAAEGTAAAVSLATPSPAAEVRADRALRWRSSVDGRPTALHLTAGGLLVEAGARTLVVEPDTGEVRGSLDAAGKGVVAADGRFVTGSGDALRSIDVADRSVRWQVPLPTVTPPTAFDDMVYGISDADVPQLIATDAASGARLWSFPRDELAFPAKTAVAAREDFVYLADEHTVYGILPTGAVAGTDTPLIAATEAATEPLCLWRQEVDEQMWTGSLVAAGDGVVVANRSGTVCLRRHADGVPIWCVPVDGVRRARPTIHDAGDQLVVVTRAAVTALDARTGAELWRQVGPWRRAVRDGDRLVAIEGDGGIAIVSLITGTVRRPVDTVVGRRALLAVDGDTVYAARRDGTLLSLDVPGGP